MSHYTHDYEDYLSIFLLHSCYHVHIVVALSDSSYTTNITVWLVR